MTAKKEQRRIKVRFSVIGTFFERAKSCKYKDVSSINV